MPSSRHVTAGTPRVAPSRRRKSIDERPLSVEERLLVTIERLLEDGSRFGAMTVEQLCKEAGISRATFYVHFKDKGELVGSLMQQLTAEVADSAGDWFRDDGEVDLKTMQQALFGIVDTFKRHQAVLAAVTDMAPHDPAIAKAHRKMMDTLCGLSRRAIAQVQRSGQGTIVEPAALADFLTTVIELYCARHIARYDEQTLPGLVDLIVLVAGRAIFRDASVGGRSGDRVATVKPGHSV